MAVPETAPRSRWSRALDRLRSICPQPGLDDQLPWTVPVLGLVVLALVAIGALWVTFDWISAVKVDHSAVINGKDYVAAKLDAIKIVLSILAGGGALFALYLAVRRQRTSERDLRARLDAQTHTENDAKARRVTELYAKAVEQLGSSAAAVRLGGLYALERLGQDNPDQRQTIANLWCAYLRMPYTPPAATVRPSGAVPLRISRNPRRRTGIQRPGPTSASPPDPAATYAEAVLERDVRLSVQRLLVKHLRPGPDGNGQIQTDYWPEIPDLDLTGAALIDFSLEKCVVPGASFKRATFRGATSFDKSTFTGAVSFEESTFGEDFADGGQFYWNAGFQGVVFDASVSFGRAVFNASANFNDSTFGGTAWFGDVKFNSFATFGEVRFVQAASFGEAMFESIAWFGGASFGGSALFGGAAFSGDTGFDRATFDKPPTLEQPLSPGSWVSGGVAVLLHSFPACATKVNWPDVWRVTREHSAIDGKCGTWHRVVPVQSVEPSPMDRAGVADQETKVDQDDPVCDFRLFPQ